MGVMIREYLGYENFAAVSGDLNITEGAAASSIPTASNALIVDIEGLHVGATRNFTRYTEQGLKSSIKSWTFPYNKPVILHHNEKDGHTIGRVNHVSYTDVDTLSGTGALIFNVSIPDKDGAEQVEDGRLLTTSVGVIGKDVRCSCCGHPILDSDGCPHHIRGHIYDGEYAYWDIYEMEAKELSYVVVPSDPYAKNIKIYKRNKNMDLTESMHSENIGGGKTKMTEEQIKELQDSVVALTEASEAQATELETAKATNADLTAKVETLTTELTEATAAKEEAVAAKETAEVALAEKTAELESEVALREAAETQVIELKESAKTELVDTYKELRKTAGKPELTEAAIAARTTDSLKDAIADLQIEIKESVQKMGPGQLADPTIITESNKETVKKKDGVGNIDLEEGLLKLFSGSANHFNK